MTTPAPLIAPNETDVRTILADRIDVQRRGVGIAAAILADGTAAAVAHGATRRRGGQAVDDGTIFEIGSVTKVFTSLVLARMAERGEVALDDPVSKFLPATVRVPERGGRRITLIDLATHTSGLPRLPSNLWAWRLRNPYAGYSIARLYACLGRHRLAREIGTAYEYSNLGGALLGHALSLAGGADFETLVRRHVCDPLGLTDTGIALPPPALARLAQGHSARLRPVPYWDQPATAGAGALRSSARDLIRFLGAWLDRDRSPLGGAMQIALAVRRPALATNDAALGWHVARPDGRELFWHNGGTGGFRSFAGFSDRRQRAVIVLSNAAVDVSDIGFHLMRQAEAPVP